MKVQQTTRKMPMFLKDQTDLLNESWPMAVGRCSSPAAVAGNSFLFKKTNRLTTGDQRSTANGQPKHTA